MSSEKNYLNDSYKSFFEDSLSVKDPELYKAIKDELIRQQQHIELIASENIVSQAVLEAQGSVLTNKYAEGYPGKRYYNGCEHVDVAEQLALERIKKLFNCKYANVQPHSGSQANTAVFDAFLKPGDKILGLDLAHGGHLTHGSAVNFSGRLYKTSFYGVDKDTGMLDYDKIRDIANISIEEKRAAKTIGSSLETAIDIRLTKDLYDLAKKYDFSEICITSLANTILDENAKDNIEVKTSKANGKKCSICWKIRETECERHPTCSFK